MDCKKTTCPVVEFVSGLFGQVFSVILVLLFNLGASPAIFFRPLRKTFDYEKGNQ